MNTQPTSKQIGKRIANLRKLRDLSQEELSKKLLISRSSLAQAELGKRNISVQELLSLSKIFGFSLDRFLAPGYAIPDDREMVSITGEPEPVVREATPALSIEKLKNVLLYILERCGGKPNVGETLLYKLLYFVDFDYFEQYEEHLTGATYRKLPYGPVPEKIHEIMDQLVRQGDIKRVKTSHHGYPQTRFLSQRTADLTRMSAAEMKVIDQVIHRFSDWSAKAISDYSHKDMPWRATPDAGDIDYELAFYRESPFSSRTYPEDDVH